MKIAIISDIHDNLINLGKCLAWFKENGISRLICCGDITNDDTLDFLASQFPGQIYLVQGNQEIYKEASLKKYKNIIYYGQIGIINLDKKVVGICHEPFLIDKIIESSDCNLIFYGHTHKPWMKEVKGVQVVNPGTLGGVFQKATFAVWESEKNSLELKILELL